jgi:hypothetical protein
MCAHTLTSRVWEAGCCCALNVWQGVAYEGSLTSSFTRRTGCSQVPAVDKPSEAVRAAYDITAALQASPPQPHPLSLRVVRSYETAPDARGLVIRWNLTNTAEDAVELGGLGFTLPADANSGGLKLEQIAYINSFLDPAISGDRGWAEWVRVTGNSSLLVLPHTRNARLEAWRPVLEDCQFDGGLSEWTVLSGAWAEEWERNQQAPVLTMDNALAAKGVWPEPRSPWPEWFSNETFRLRPVQVYTHQDIAAMLGFTHPPSQAGSCRCHEI